MRSQRRIILPTITALLLTGAACGDGPEEIEPADTTQRAAAPAMAGAPDTAAAGTRAALPRLFSIMLGLQGDMERISRGLWAESYDTIAAGARAVADHPMIGPDGIQRIQGVIGDDIARFKALDTRVHDLAVELEAAAGAGDLEAAFRRDAALRQSCLECHTEFRVRLRQAIN